MSFGHRVVLEEGKPSIRVDGKSKILNEQRSFGVPAAEEPKCASLGMSIHSPHARDISAGCKVDHLEIIKYMPKTP